MLRLFMLRASLLSLATVCTGTFLFGQAQLYPLKVADRAIENGYVLHAKDWPPTLGLPNAAMMRTNAGERWFQIETRRGQFSPTFGNLFLPDTGWVAMAQKYGTELTYTFNTVPGWAVHGAPENGPAKVAPDDIDAHDEVCEPPLAGYTSPNGNCVWKEWVTALMEKNCGVHGAPAHPLTGQCKIHYFETWNEFNAEGFWDDTLAHLARMANDMAAIVRVYCGDCWIIAGSTSAGGRGRGGDGPKGSGSFDVALGELLDAWHRQPNASLPDIVSFHAYPSRTNVMPPPFPETNVSTDSKCAASLVPNPSCDVPVVDQPGRIRKMLAARPYLRLDTPIWNTESGWNGNGTLMHGVDAAGFADAATGFLRQAYFARMAILLANAGVAVNLWYEADHQCFGTLYGLGAATRPSDISGCKSDPPIPEGLTPAGHALVALHAWLHGATFSAACESSGTVWWCPMQSAAGAEEIVAWTTKLGQSESADESTWPKFRYAHTLDGGTAELRPGEKPLLEGRPRLFNNVR